MEFNHMIDVVIEESGDVASEERNQPLFEALRAGLPGHFLRIEERSISQV